METIMLCKQMGVLPEQLDMMAYEDVLTWSIVESQMKGGN